jgi:hypothetical protein
MKKKLLCMENMAGWQQKGIFGGGEEEISDYPGLTLHIGL